MEFSHRNVYGSKKYNEFINSQQYLLDNKFFDRTENCELSDGFSIELKHYEETEKVKDYFLVINNALKCTLKSTDKIIYEYYCFNSDSVILKRIINHSNGHRYFIFKIALFGISCIDVDTLEVYNYIPEGYSYERERMCGESFIVTDIYYNKESNLVAYNGCYWACPFDVMVGDFSNPLDFNPHLVSLHDIIDPDYSLYDDISFKEWKNGRIYVICDSKTEKSISVDELKDMINKLTTKGEK